MFIKFESKESAPFIMQSQFAEQILAMAGQGRRMEGSISGAAIKEALTSLDKALAQQAGQLDESIDEDEDEDEEREQVSLGARAAPLREMLIHAQQIDSYVMWRPE